MIHLQRSRTVLCLICFAVFVAHGCAGTSSTGTPSATTPTTVPSAVGTPASAKDMDPSKSALYWSGKGLWKWDDSAKLPYRRFTLNVYQDQTGYWVLYTVENPPGLHHAGPAKQRVKLQQNENGRYIPMPWASEMTFFLDELRAVAPRSNPPATSVLEKTGSQ